MMDTTALSKKFPAKFPAHFYFLPLFSYCWHNGSEHMYIGWLKWMFIVSFLPNE
jgi:hypothetical protein